MDSATRKRLEEKLWLLESVAVKCCDEISEISFALVQPSDKKNRARYENRLNELRLEMKKVWEEYSALVKGSSLGLSVT